MTARNLHHTLIKNYIVFVFILLALSVIALLFLGFSLNSQMSREMSPKISASDVAQADYKNIDMVDISQMGGWVEILDNENNVVFTKGDKKTTAIKYDNSQLYQLLSYMGIGQQYICTAKAFTTEDGRNYTCLVILPGDSADLQLNLIKSPLSLSRKFLAILSISLLFFIGIFALNVFLYSKWTAKKISKPIDSITGGIRQLRCGKLDTRMKFKAENEFLQIRDAFNDMADRLESTQNENVKLEEVRNRMFIDISHDLKTPITVICGYSKALAEDMVSDEHQKQRYLDTIYDKSVRVSNLIDNLFELAKLENTNISTVRTNMDVVEFLRGIAAEHFEQIEEKGLLLDLKLPEEALYYVMDKKEMSRVISNLLDNAIQYNSSGTIIKIELFKQENEIVIRIADNGSGISKELKDTIFEPFVRGDAARGSEGGTGLGLAIARKIVENHGGSLKLKSDEEAFKTVFIISLPL